MHESSATPLAARIQNVGHPKFGYSILVDLSVLPSFWVLLLFWRFSALLSSMSKKKEVSKKKKVSKEEEERMLCPICRRDIMKRKLKEHQKTSQNCKSTLAALQYHGFAPTTDDDQETLCPNGPVVSDVFFQAQLFLSIWKTIDIVCTVQPFNAQFFDWDRAKELVTSGLKKLKETMADEAVDIVSDPPSVSDPLHESKGSHVSRLGREDPPHESKGLASKSTVQKKRMVKDDECPICRKTIDKAKILEHNRSAFCLSVLNALKFHGVMDTREKQLRNVKHLRRTGKMAIALLESALRWCELNNDYYRFFSWAALNAIIDRGIVKQLFIQALKDQNGKSSDSESDQVENKEDEGDDDDEEEDDEDEEDEDEQTATNRQRKRLHSATLQDSQRGSHEHRVLSPSAKKPKNCND